MEKSKPQLLQGTSS